MDTVIDTLVFGDAAGLARAVQELVDCYPKEEVIYVESAGFYANGAAVLIERTLTDGSKVYNIVLKKPIER